MDKSENGRISRRVGWVDYPQDHHVNGSTWKQKVFPRQNYDRPQPFHITSGSQDCCEDYWYSDHDCALHLAGLFSVRSSHLHLNKVDRCLARYSPRA